MRYSEFQLLIRRLTREDLVECDIEEVFIAEQAHKESELIEHLILNQPNTHLVKVRLTHEIDECLRDYKFFEGHARRELDRANKIYEEENQKLRDDAAIGHFRTNRHAPYIVRNIISGVEEGISLYVEILEKYFPEELGRYDPEQIGYFLSPFSKLGRCFTGIPSNIYELKNLPTNLERYNYWKEHIAPNVQDLKLASEYWGYPDYLLFRSENINLSDLGYIPVRFRSKLFDVWYWDKDIIHQITHRRTKEVTLPMLTEGLEKKIEENSKYGLGDNEQLIKTELEKCDRYNVDLKPTDITLAKVGRYYFKILYHEYYRAYLLNRLEELKNPQGKKPSYQSAAIEEEISHSDTFEDLLSEEGRKFLPYMKSKYKDAKPGKIVPLLFALNDLGLWGDGIFPPNQTILHECLSAMFGDVGTRQALNVSISSHNAPNSSQHERIEQAKKEIKRILSK